MAKFLDDAGLQHLLSKLDERYMTKAAAENMFIDKEIGDRMFLYNKIATTQYNMAETYNTAFLNPRFTYQLIDIQDHDNAGDTDYQYAFIGVDLSSNALGLIGDQALADMNPTTMSDGDTLYNQYFGPHRVIIRLVGSWVSSSVGGLVIQPCSNNPLPGVLRDPPKVTFNDMFVFTGSMTDAVGEYVTGAAYSDGSFQTIGRTAYTLTYAQPWAENPTSDASKVDSPTMIILDYIVMPVKNMYGARVFMTPHFMNCVVKTGLPS